MPYGEAIHLVNELQRDWGSHLSADLGGWGWAASYGELLQAVHLEAYLNAHRDEKKQHAPFVVPKPSDQVKPRVSAVERARAESYLEEHSVFR